MRDLFVLTWLGASALSAGSLPNAAIKTACGPDAVKFNVAAVKDQAGIPDPESGKALVFVIENFERPANELGRPTLRVGLDGDWVGANRGSSYIYFPVEPGDRHLCVNWQSPPPWVRPLMGAHSLKAEAGQTYYFRARIFELSGSFALDFDLVNNDEGRLLVANSPRSQFHQK
jgi:hypothetical protein